MDIAVVASERNRPHRHTFDDAGQAAAGGFRSRRRVLGVLSDYGGLAFTLSELAEAAGVTSSVIKGVVKQGVVREAAGK